MLGGVTRMTISITLLAMEGTGSLQLIIPLMLAVFTAKIAGDALTLPIYDIQIKIRGAPVLVGLYSSCCVAKGDRGKGRGMFACLASPAPARGQACTMCK